MANDEKSDGSRVHLEPIWVKDYWHRYPQLVLISSVVLAFGAIATLIWPITDVIAAHDVGLLVGPGRAAALQAAREAVRTQLLTLGAGVFAAGALVFTARNFTLSRRTGERDQARLFNERFAVAASQLGHDSPAVRLAGVYAMAGLADDWPDRRQTCVSVLCAHLRLPPTRAPGGEASIAEREAWQADREVRHTVIRIIGDRLRGDGQRSPGTASWRGLNLDFTGVVFDGGDFSDAEFSGNVSFIGTEFTGDTVYFNRAKFLSGRVSFDGAVFSGGAVDFRKAQFGDQYNPPKTSSAEYRSDDETADLRASIYVGDRFASGPVSFVSARFTLGGADFREAIFLSGSVDFREAWFEDFTADFEGAHFDGGTVSFNEVSFRGRAVHFENAHFAAGRVGFEEARFVNEGTVYFTAAEFTGAGVSFQRAKFAPGTSVSFQQAKFSEGTIDYTEARFAGGWVDFRDACFNGALILFNQTETYGSGTLNFDQAHLTAGRLNFSKARFYSGTVDFSKSRFLGATVDLSEVENWSSRPLLPGPLTGLILPAGYYPAGYGRPEPEPDIV